VRERPRKQQRGGGDRGRPGAPLNGVAPARRGRLAVPLGRQRPAEERDPQPVDPRTQIGEERQQRLTAAAATTKTAREAEIATPYMYGSPVKRGLEPR
jgi:hypothetical protein